MASATPLTVDDDVVALVMPRRAGPRVVVDLTDFRWVTPAAITVIAAQAQYATAQGETFAVTRPARSEPARYAARMHLGELLADLGAQHDLPVVPERDQGANLLEVTAVRSDNDADRLARLVYDKVRERDRVLAAALHRSIGEIGANVADHAGTVGFVAAQALPRRRELMVAVADTGLGLLRTLVHRGVEDDLAAIDLAVESSASQFDDPERGLGLPSTLRLVRQLGGSLYVATGRASVRHGTTTRTARHVDQSYPGTVVEVRIPLDR